jgi:hypothetical membrane protein
VTTSRLGLTTAAVLWIVAGLAFVGLEAVSAAAVVPTYSYTHGYISDLGVPAWSPKAEWMNTAFWVQGIGFLAGAIAVGRAVGGAALFVWLAVANAVGNLLVAVAHGGSALVVAGYAWLHVVGAVLVIVAGNTAIVVGSSTTRRVIRMRGYRAVSIVIAALGFVCLALLSIATSKGMPPGTLERGSVYSILLWQIVTGLLLLRETAFRQRTVEAQ